MVSDFLDSQQLAYSSLISTPIDRNQKWNMYSVVKDIKSHFGREWLGKF